MAKRGVVGKQVKAIRGAQKPGSERHATRRAVNAEHKLKNRSRG